MSYNPFIWICITCSRTDLKHNALPIQSQKEVEEERLHKGLKARKRRAAAVPDDSDEVDDEGEDEDEDASSEPEKVGAIPFEIKWNIAFYSFWEFKNQNPYCKCVSHSFEKVKEETKISAKGASGKVGQVSLALGCFVVSYTLPFLGLQIDMSCLKLCHALHNTLPCLA